MPDRQDLARLFFALWPDADLVARLAAAADRLHQVFGGRRTCAASLHMTLAFLGEVPRARLPELHSLATGLRAQPCAFELDRVACWRHNHIACLSASQTPVALGSLAKDLADSLRRAGFALERRAFRPHVTLLRKAVCGPDNPTLAPIGWAAREFVLVESVPAAGGSVYSVLRHYPLT